MSLQFRETMDSSSREIFRADGLVGRLQWHHDRKPRVVFHLDDRLRWEPEASLDEMREILDEFDRIQKAGNY